MRRHLRLFRICAEMSILFAVLLAVDHGFLSGQAFSQVEPNPYWLPVVIMALTYGTGAGLWAAIIATGIWVAAPHNRAEAGDQLEMLLRLSLQPLMWIVVALVIGEVTASRKIKIREQEKRGDETERKLERMADALARLAKINRTLQIRIATEERTVGQAISAAIGLTEPSQANRIQAVTRLIALAAQTENFTFYDVRGGQIIARFGGRAAHNRPHELSQTDLSQMMIAGPALAHAGPAADRKALARVGIVALPVRTGDGGVLLGVLVIHALPQSRLTEARIAELSHVADSLGRLSVLFSSDFNSIRPATWLLSEGQVA